MHKCDECFYCAHDFKNNDVITTCLLCDEVVCDISPCEMYTSIAYAHSCSNCVHFDITCNQCAKTGKDLSKFEKFDYATDCGDFEIDPESNYCKKVPLGVRPLYVLICERISELADAIRRYSGEVDVKANREKVKEWGFEIKYLCDFLEWYEKKVKEDMNANNRHI